MARNLVGLDLGTTTITGVLFDTEDAQVRRLTQRRNDASLFLSLPTRAEQDPRRLRALALEILAELAAVGESVDGIALTGQMHGLLCVDGENRPLTSLISWQDRRTAESLSPGQAGCATAGAVKSDPTTLDSLHARLADLAWRSNGCRIQHGYGAATLFWLAQQAELPLDSHGVCTIADWLAGQLVGRAPVTDPSQAASWGIYDLVSGAWNAAFLDRLGLDPALLPPVHASGARLGGLAPGVARRVGLPAGTPVYNALGDNQAAFLGSVQGVSDLQYTILVNLGTGGQICWAASKFEPPTDRVETRPLTGGRYLHGGASLCGGAAYAWLGHTVRAWLAEFGVELDEETAYRRLDELAGKCEGRQGLRVRPTFLGVRGDPDCQAGAIEGITLDNLRLGPLARATMVGMVDELRELYLECGERTGVHTHVVAAGGAVRKNPLLPGIIGERFGLPVGMPPWREPAAVGAALWAEPKSGQCD